MNEGSAEDILLLDDGHREIQEAAHRFAEEVVRPVGIRLDRLPAQEAVGPDSPLRRVMAQATELGYTRLSVPVELGGLGLSPLGSYLVQEELAWGSVGVGAVLLLSAITAGAAAASGNPSLIEEFALPFLKAEDGSVVGCWGITEPDHGSDALAVMRPELRVKARGQLVAQPKGDDWVLNGQKSAWVSNAPIATHAMLNVQLEPSAGLERGGVCLVPLDLPGVSRGPALEKLGIRSLPQGELFFDNVRIPRQNMVVEVEGYADHVRTTLTAFNAGAGCSAAGLARAAYESALRYTRERVQGGRPIFEHQSVRSRLFRMYSLVQASRTLSCQTHVRVATLLQRGEVAPLQDSIASKVFCSRAALEIATLGVQLHGGVGMTQEYPAEMFLRDASSLTIADGENELLSQMGGALL
jgi:alkylation response protein AidB-like acyl-CoA dehydrogenase